MSPGEVGGMIHPSYLPSARAMNVRFSTEGKEQMRENVSEGRIYMQKMERVLRMCDTPRKGTREPWPPYHRRTSSPR